MRNLERRGKRLIGAGLIMAGMVLAYHVGHSNRVADDEVALIGRAEAAGGKIVKPVFEFPGGRRFHFTDPDGYELAVWTTT